MCLRPSGNFVNDALLAAIIRIGAEFEISTGVQNS